MNTTRLKQARRLFCNDLTPRHIQRANVLKWARAIKALGPNWVCHPEHKKKVEKEVTA